MLFRSDAWELASALRECHGIGELHGLARRFSLQRRADRRAGIAVTDALARAFAHRSAPLRAASGAAMLTLDLVPLLRNRMVDAMMLGLRKNTRPASINSTTLAFDSQ